MVRNINRKQVYPVFIVETKAEEHAFLACVPDMDIVTQGDSVADAMEMARDAIGITGISMEDHRENIPKPSDMKQAWEMVLKDRTVVDYSDGIATYVDVNFAEYRRRLDNRTVRRNVALPSWLNYEAEKAGINVSRVLQEALIHVLGLEGRR